MTKLILTLSIALIISLSFSGYLLYEKQNNETIKKVEIEDGDIIVELKITSKGVSSDEISRKFRSKILPEDIEISVAAIYVNQAQQMQAAATLYEVTEGRPVVHIGNIIGDYITKKPTPARNSELSNWLIDRVENVVFIKHILLNDESINFTHGMCVNINDYGDGVVHCVKDSGLMNETISQKDKRFSNGDKVVIFMKL